MILKTLTLLFALFFVSSSVAELIESTSFQAPFDNVGSNGKRMVEGWQAFGDTDIKQNFVRLTTDRQSKRGTLWSKDPVGAYKEISAILTFRISGQGKKLFGDGIGLWLTHFNRQQQGNLHGIDGKFVGISVIIDTFKNVEHGAKHRDVTILVNNGQETLTIGDDENPIGCNVDGLRYHEDRDDFSVFNTSRLRLLLNEDRLIVEVDPMSSNEWQTCGTVSGLKKKLPKGFLAKAKFGLSGTTGQLADNHDVLSLLVHDSHSEGKVFAVQQHEENESVDELQKIVHDLEHKLTSITEKLQNTIEKLQQQETLVEDRVKVLEKTIQDGVQNKMEKRITNLEKGLDKKMQRKISSEGKKIHQSIDNLKDMQDGIDTSGWKTPFFLLVLIVAGAAFFGYRHYRKLVKSHLL